MLAYLDNNATTRPLPAVVEAVMAALGDAFGNPSSIRPLGERARDLVEEARRNVAELLACRPGEVIFTSSATESINTALRGAFQALPKEKPRRLILSSVEHEAVIEVARHLEKRRVSRWPRWASTERGVWTWTPWSGNSGAEPRCSP